MNPIISRKDGAMLYGAGMAFFIPRFSPSPVLLLCFISLSSYLLSSYNLFGYTLKIKVVKDASASKA
jgi:hypothetical protein